LKILTSASFWESAISVIDMMSLLSTRFYMTSTFLHLYDGLVLGPLSTIFQLLHHNTDGGHHGRDRMVVGFTTTYAVSIYRH
jgi:hypothetical protein